jgi:hypothetical protein
MEAAAVMYALGFSGATAALLGLGLGLGLVFDSSLAWGRPQRWYRDLPAPASRRS